MSSESLVHTGAAEAPMPRWRELARAALHRGFGWVLLAEVGSRLLGYAGTVVVIRLLPREIYGSYAYALNLLAIAMLFSGLGIHSGVLQQVSAARSAGERGALLRFGLRFGLAVNGVLSLGLVGVALLAPLPIEGSATVLLWLAGLPLLATTYETGVAFLRAELRSRGFAGVRLAFGAAGLAGIVLLASAYSLAGVVVARYLAYAAALAVAGLLLRGARAAPGGLAASQRRALARFSLYSAAAGALSEALYVADTFLLGWITGDASLVASYRTATILPFALNFLPLAFLTFAYPHFVRGLGDRRRLMAHYRRLVAVLALLNLAITVPLIAFAPQVVVALFGPEYADAVGPFRVLMLGYFAAGTLRIPAGNLLASLGRVRLNMAVAGAAIVLNGALDWWLIHAHGAMGAAVATSCVLLLTGLVSNLRLWGEGS